MSRDVMKAYGVLTKAGAAEFGVCDSTSAETSLLSRQPRADLSGWPLLSLQPVQ